MRTIAEVRATLPNITVKTDRGFVVGRVEGRKNRFATVIIGSGDAERTFQATWEVVKEAYNNNFWIIY